MSGAQVLRIGCPQCGGTLPVPIGRSIVECEFCGQRSRVEVPGHRPRYAALPAVDRTRLRQILQDLFADPQTPRDMATLARPRSLVLYFVPFYEAYGQRGGVRVTRREARWTENDPLGRGLPDSIVVLGDFLSAAPAVRLPGWGIEHLDVALLRGAQSSARLIPFDARFLASEGVVLEPDLPEGEALAEIERKRAGAGDAGIEILDLSVSVVYFPVWRASIVYRGQQFVLTVDAVTGTILRARAPENDQFRVPYFLALTGICGWLVGSAARAAATSLDRAQIVLSALFINETTILFGIMVTLAAALGLTFLLGLSWDKLRYPSEIVVIAGRRFREVIGRPEKTFFDKLMAWEMAALDALLRSATRSRRAKGDDLW